MKTKYMIGLLCALALAGLFTITKAPAQGNARRITPAATIVIGYGQYLGPLTDAGRHVEWLKVEWVDRSDTAPAIIFKDQRVAQAIADAQNNGFEVWPQTGRPELIFNRPAF